MDIIEPVELIMWIFAGKDQQTPIHAPTSKSGVSVLRSVRRWMRQRWH